MVMDFRFIEFGGRGWVDLEEEFIVARRGDTIKGYAILKNTGDEVIEDLLIMPAHDPFASFSEKQSWMNDLMISSLTFEEPRLPDKIIPGDEVMVEYTLQPPCTGPFQFIILATATNKSGTAFPGYPVNYRAEIINAPYVSHEEWIIDFELPNPPRKSRFDYEDILIEPLTPEGATPGDKRFIPWIWLNKGGDDRWKIRAYLRTPGGFTPRITDKWMGFIYTGFSVPVDPGRIMNYDWLKSQSPHFTVDVSWEEATIVTDYFLLKGVIR